VIRHMEHRTAAEQSAVYCGRSRRCAAAALSLLLALTLPTAGQTVPGQLNTELYGRGVGTVRPSGMAAMGNVPWNLGALPSENRNAAVMSGRLRSEYRGEYLAQGPLAPGGVGAYIPMPSLPYGSVRPYDTAPRPVAGPVPAGPSTWTGGGSTRLPTSYVGVLHNAPTSSVGTLRSATPAAPLPAAPSSDAMFVKPPLVTPNYGALRAPVASPTPATPQLKIPPPLPASEPAPTIKPND
jgi:hypothetical protein